MAREEGRWDSPGAEESLRRARGMARGGGRWDSGGVEESLRRPREGMAWQASEEESPAEEAIL